MLLFSRHMATALVLLGSACCLPVSAGAQQQPPCTTQNECAAREEQRDDAARREQYSHMVQSQTDAHAAAIQALGEVRARVAGNRQAKVQAILQRRRDAYARVRN